MSQTTTAEMVALDAAPASTRTAVVLNRGLFGALLLVIVLTAIPYGTSYPWWKALFICAVLGLTIVAVVEAVLSGGTKIEGTPVLVPLATIATFALLQTISFRAASPDPALTVSPWNAISADPYETRFVALQFLAIGLTLALMYRYVNTHTRIRVMLHVLLMIAVTSAMFGLARYAMQSEPGFILPILRPGAGYAQFSNKNHFGFMMVMAFGLGLGAFAGGAFNRRHFLIYVAALLSIWTGLVLSASRGAILAMFGQLVVAALLIPRVNGGLLGPDSILVRWTQSIALRVCLVIVLVVAAVVGTMWVGGDRLISSFENVGSEFQQPNAARSEGVTRTEIWRATLSMFRAHPITGTGLGAYWIAITAYHNASGAMTPQEAHNDYLELLAGGGLIAVAIGLWFVVVVYRAMQRSLSGANRFRRAVWYGAVLGLSGAAIHSFFDFGLHMMTNALMFVALLMMATANVSVGKQQNY